MSVVREVWIILKKHYVGHLHTSCYCWPFSLIYSQNFGWKTSVITVQPIALVQYVYEIQDQFLRNHCYCNNTLLVCFLQMISMLPTRTLKLLEFVGFSGNKVSSAGDWEPVVADRRSSWQDWGRNGFRVRDVWRGMDCSALCEVPGLCCWKVCVDSTVNCCCNCSFTGSLIHSKSRPWFVVKLIWLLPSWHVQRSRRRNFYNYTTWRVNDLKIALIITTNDCTISLDHDFLLFVVLKEFFLFLDWFGQCNHLQNNLKSDVNQGLCPDITWGIILIIWLILYLTSGVSRVKPTWSWHSELAYPVYLALCSCIFCTQACVTDLCSDWVSLVDEQTLLILQHKLNNETIMQFLLLWFSCTGNVSRMH